MPLYEGEKNIGKNLATLQKEGYSRRQAAFSKAGKSNDKDKR